MRFLELSPAARATAEDSAADFLLSLAAAGRARSTISSYLSALRWAARVLGLPLDAAYPLHDKMVHAIPRVRGALAWIHPATVRHLAASPCVSARDRVLTGLAILSYFHALRISEVLRLSPSSFTLSVSPPLVRIVPSKTRDALPVTAVLHPQAVAWARRLCVYAASGGALPFCTLEPRELNAWLRYRLRGTRDADATWHGFRRGCATYLWHLGFSLASIQRVGRWQSPAVARMYVYAWIE